MTTIPPRTPDEVVRLGETIFAARIRHTLRPEDDGRFVAVDVDTGDFETDEDDITVVARLRVRRPKAVVWLGRVGEPATYLLRTAQ